MSIRELDPNVLIRTARDRTGLSDFGSDDFRPALTAYIGGLKDNADAYTSVGAMAIFEELAGALAGRLKIRDFLLRNPEAAQRPVLRPVFITGLYRSATTRLQGLLAADPQWMHLRPWHTAHPVPFPGGNVNGEDPRIEATRKGLAFLQKAAPHAALAHPMHVDKPAEEFALLTSSFRVTDAKQFGPSFRQWLASHDTTPAYEGLRRALQVLQFQDAPDIANQRRFLLKAPSHLGNIKQLLSVFPDAKIIFTHRDPFPAIHSFTMVRESLRGIYVDEIDPKGIGTEIMEQAATALDNFVAVRSSSPDAACFDLRFEEIVQRMFDHIDDLYAFLDAPLTSNARDLLMRADAEGEDHKSKAHGRSAGVYGLSRERVHERTRDYLNWTSGHVGALC